MAAIANYLNYNLLTMSEAKNNGIVLFEYGIFYFTFLLYLGRIAEMIADISVLFDFLWVE